MNLLLLEPGDVSVEGNVRLSGARALHLLNVLKVTNEQHVRVGLVDGPLGRGTVQAKGDGAVDLHCVFTGDVPPRPSVDLLLALPRPKVLQRLWAQIAALGVGRVLLTNAERVERNYFDTHVLQSYGYRPLLLEGLQQARDTRLPEVSVHRQFKMLVEDDLDRLSGDSLRVVADPAALHTVTDVVHRHRPARVLLAIGPEGGWNPFELGLLEAHAFRAIGLGPRTLRSDTACLALLSLVHEALRK